MTHHTWKITAGGLPHTVELEHGIYLGKRIITVDGREIDRVSRKLFDYGSVHLFNVADAYCELVITTNGITFDYLFRVDGQHILSEQQENRKRYRPSKQVCLLLKKVEFDRQLSRLIGLRLQTVRKTSQDAYGVFAGEIRGYLVTVDRVYRAQPLEELLRVIIYCEPGDDFAAVFHRMEHSQDFQDWLKLEKKKKRAHEGASKGYMVLLSLAKNPPVEKVADRINRLISILAAYCPPAREYHCDIQDCKGSSTDPVNLVFVQNQLALMCDSCIRGLPDLYKRAEQEYRVQPHKLGRLALASVPVLLLLGFITGGVSYGLERNSAILSFVVAIGIVFKLAEKLKVKASLWIAGIGFLAGLGAIAASMYSQVLFYLMFRNYWTVSPALFAKALEMLRRRPEQLYTILIVSGLIGIMFLATMLPGYFKNRKQVFRPDATVAGRVETFLTNNK